MAANFATATAIAIAADNQRATATAIAIAVGNNATNIVITFSIAMDAKTATAIAIAPTPMSGHPTELPPCKGMKRDAAALTGSSGRPDTPRHHHRVITIPISSRPHWLDIDTSIHRGQPPYICQWRFFVIALQGIAALEGCREPPHVTKYRGQGNTPRKGKEAATSHRGRPVA